MFTGIRAKGGDLYTMQLRIEAILAICILVIILRFVKRSNEVKQEQNAWHKKQDTDDGKPLPYRKKYLLTKPEYKFYLVLKEVCDSHHYLICPKVGLKELANVTSKDNYYHWFYKISAKHVDFVITDGNLLPYKAIELDDRSHKRPEVQERDKFKNEFFAAIHLPLLRFEMNYTKEAIEAALFAEKHSNLSTQTDKASR